MDYSDQTICQLLHKSNPKGMEYLFIKYYRPLVLYSQTLLSNLSDAEDVVQELLIVIWEKIQKTDRKEWKPETLKSYLFISVKNASINRLKKKDPLRQTFDYVIIDKIWEEYDFTDDERIHFLEKELDTLSPKNREIIESIYTHGMSYKEVARKFGISEATVNSTLVRTIKTLRDKAGKFKKIILFLILKKYILK